MARILVADDSKMIRDVFTFVLKNHGFDVDLAEDGAEAIRKVGGGRFDLVITDLNMPNGTGIDVISAVRSSTRNAHTPVYVVSTEVGSEKKAAARQAGANGWIGKPVTEERILKAVRAAVA